MNNGWNQMFEMPAFRPTTECTTQFNENKVFVVESFGYVYSKWSILVKYTNGMFAHFEPPDGTIGLCDKYNDFKRHAQVIAQKLFNNKDVKIEECIMQYPLSITVGQ